MKRTVLIAWLLVLLNGCASAPPAWRTFVAPSDSWYSFHFRFPSAWSVEWTKEDIKLRAPDRSVVLTITAHEPPANPRARVVDGCADELIARAPAASRPVRMSQASANSLVVIFQTAGAAPEAPAMFGACLQSTTQLEYPLVTITAAAPSAALERHAETLKKIVDSVRFRPAF